MSAPWSSGLNRYGVAKVLSTTSGTPWEWHMSASASMSIRLALGFPMGSTKTILVFSLMAASKFPTVPGRVGSTKVHSTPWALIPCWK